MSETAIVAAYVSLAKCVLGQLVERLPSMGCTPQSEQHRGVPYLQRELTDQAASMLQSCFGLTDVADGDGTFRERLTALMQQASPVSIAAEWLEPELSIGRFFRDYFLRSLAWPIVFQTTTSASDGLLEQAAVRAVRAWRSRSVTYTVCALFSGAVPPEEASADPGGASFGEWLLHSRGPGRHLLREPNPLWIGGGQPTQGCFARTVLCQKDRKPTEALRSAASELREVIGAFRLATDAHVGVGSIAAFPSEECYHTMPQTQCVFPAAESGADWQRPWQVTLLTKDDIEAIKSLLSGRPFDAKVRVAVHRFQLAASRASVSDELVDLVIALEATLLCQNDREQLAYRFAVFAACITSDSEDPAATFALAKSLYAMRSRVVHSGQQVESSSPKDLTGLSPHDYMAQVRSLTRRIVRVFVQASIGGRPPLAVVEELQAEMFRRIDRRTPN
jgi:hypothetical protein